MVRAIGQRRSCTVWFFPNGGSFATRITKAMVKTRRWASGRRFEYGCRAWDRSALRRRPAAARVPPYRAAALTALPSGPGWPSAPVMLTEILAHYVPWAARALAAE